MQQLGLALRAVCALTSSETPHDRHRAACSARRQCCTTGSGTQPEQRAARGPRWRSTAFNEVVRHFVLQLPDRGPNRCLAERRQRRRRMHISAPPAVGPAMGPLATNGQELRDSELLHGGQRDAVTVCFQSLPITVDDSQWSILI